jgi:hypothetical protein
MDRYDPPLNHRLEKDLRMVTGAKFSMTRRGCPDDVDTEKGR